MSFSSLKIINVVLLTVLSLRTASSYLLAFTRNESRVVIPENLPPLKPFYTADLMTSRYIQDININISIIKTVQNGLKSPGQVKTINASLLFSVDIGGHLHLPESSMGLLKHGQTYEVTLEATLTHGKNVEKASTRIYVAVEANFCGMKYKLRCFPQPLEYIVLEESKELIVDAGIYPKTLVDYCKHISAHYEISTGAHIINVDPNGVISLIKPLDMELLTSYEIELNCWLNINGNPKQKFVSKGRLSLVDTDDQPPMVRNKETVNIYFNRPTKKIRKGSILKVPQESELFVVDYDTDEVNKYNLSIEGDSQNVFRIKNSVQLYNRHSHRTVIHAVLEYRKQIRFDNNIYMFYLAFHDLTYVGSKSSKIRIQIIVHQNQTLNIEASKPEFFRRKNLDVRELYTVTMHRQVAPFYRVFDEFKSILTKEDRYNFRIKSQSSSNLTDMFGVTKRTGIIYVKKPYKLSTAEELAVSLTLSWRSRKRRRWSSTVVNINISDPTFDDDNSRWKCETFEESCSLSTNSNLCGASCGIGSMNRQCIWRSNDDADKMTSNYATCSPDLKTCPDGQCDELEQTKSDICPQDCSDLITGEYIQRRGAPGIERAVGTCSCYYSAKFYECSCSRPMSKSINKMNVSHRTRNPNDKVFEFTSLVTEPTTPNPYPQLTAEDVTSCGNGCIAFIVLAICSFTICMILIWRTWCCGFTRSRNKFVNNAVNMAAIPSDYVDELSSSAVESSSQGMPSDIFQTTSVGPEALDVTRPKIQFDSKWEFPRHRVKILQTLGEGEFGKVMKAKAYGILSTPIYTIVAVKMLKNNGSYDEMKDLVSELTLLKELSHPNVIKLLGACTQKGGPIYMIVEYAQYGALRTCLRRCRNLHPYTIDSSNSNEPSSDLSSYVQHSTMTTESELTLTNRDLLGFAWQICKGMQYLSNLKLVHRDLATRNILLADGKVIKISDFGLTRDVYEADTYVKRSKGRVPVKWMAIESLEDHLYTTKSDVWAFGIVLWEIVTLGASPYPGITLERLFPLLKSGYRMERPENCSIDLYKLMKKCWQENPCLRPTFGDLTETFDKMLQEGVEYIDLSSLTETETKSRCPVADTDQTSDPEDVDNNEVEHQRLFDSNDQFTNISSPSTNHTTVQTYSLLQPLHLQEDDVHHFCPPEG